MNPVFLVKVEVFECDVWSRAGAEIKGQRSKVRQGQDVVSSEVSWGQAAVDDDDDDDNDDDDDDDDEEEDCAVQRDKTDCVCECFCSDLYHGFIFSWTVWCGLSLKIVYIFSTSDWTSAQFPSSCRSLLEDSRWFQLKSK